ncbi:hypothetical protein HYH03_006966 [Edaphochlamys debaryana]|uniref:Uncharacterized protein n=1 Tax=Edaphochlamys debaryana TaxID=47281 RepID=A0A835YCK7_9CHLO|nr:hypothetical protein HYH03_006966 [Edaphochlamys debaryana]|eukprot:KAG2495034.1 hypothetical protein HYH03_006966 [Edaphochlamys debaryana]
MAYINGDAGAGWKRHWEVIDRVGRPEFTPDPQLLSDVMFRAGVGGSGGNTRPRSSSPPQHSAGRGGGRPTRNAPGASAAALAAPIGVPGSVAQDPRQRQRPLTASPQGAPARTRLRQGLTRQPLNRTPQPRPSSHSQQQQYELQQLRLSAAQQPEFLTMSGFLPPDARLSASQNLGPFDEDPLGQPLPAPQPPHRLSAANLAAHSGGPQPQPGVGLGLGLNQAWMQPQPQPYNAPVPRLQLQDMQPKLPDYAENAASAAAADAEAKLAAAAAGTSAPISPARAAAAEGESAGAGRSVLGIAAAAAAAVAGSKGGGNQGRISATDDNDDDEDDEEESKDEPPAADGVIRGLSVLPVRSVSFHVPRRAHSPSDMGDGPSASSLGDPAPAGGSTSRGPSPSLWGSSAGDADVAMPLRSSFRGITSSMSRMSRGPSLSGVPGTLIIPSENSTRGSSGHGMLTADPSGPARGPSMYGMSALPTTPYTPAAAAPPVWAASAVPPRERYRGILERVGRVAEHRSKERRRLGAAAASVGPANARWNTPPGATAGRNSPGGGDDSSGDSDDEEQRGGGKTPRGLSSWGGRWWEQLRAITTGQGLRPPRQKQEADAQAEGEAEEAGPEEHAAWQLARSLDELTRFSCLAAVMGAGLTDGSVLAEVDARIAALQRAEAAAMDGRTSLLPPPPPAFPLAAAQEYLAASQQGVLGLEELEEVIRAMRRKLQVVVGRDGEDLRRSALSALRSFRRGGDGDESPEPTSTSPPPQQGRPPSPPQHLGSFDDSRRGSAPPALAAQPSRFDLRGGTSRRGFASLTLPASTPTGAESARLAPDPLLSQPSQAALWQGPDDGDGPGGGGGGAGRVLNHTLSAAFNAALAGGRSGAATARAAGTTAGFTSAAGLDQAWSLLESLMIQLHDSHATRSELVSAIEQDADGSAAGGGGGGPSGATSAGPGTARSTAKTPRGSGAAAAGSGASGAAALGGGPSTARSARAHTAVDRLVSLMDATMELGATNAAFMSAGLGGPKGKGPDTERSNTQSARDARAAVMAAAAADPLVARNAMRAAVAAALEPEHTEQVLYYLTKVSLMLQQDPRLPPDAGFLIAAGMDLLLGEVSWLLALLRTSAGAGSPHLQALGAALRAYEGQRHHAQILGAAAERLELALEDAMDRAAHAEKQLAAVHSMLQSAGHNVSDLTVYTSELERELERLQGRNEVLEETIAELEGDMSRVEAAHTRRGAAVSAGQRLASVLREAHLERIEELSQGVQVAMEGDCADPRAWPSGPLPASFSRSASMARSGSMARHHGPYGGPVISRTASISSQHQPPPRGSSSGPGPGPGPGPHASGPHAPGHAAHGGAKGGRHGRKGGRRSSGTDEEGPLSPDVHSLDGGRRSPGLALHPGGHGPPSRGSHSGAAHGGSGHGGGGTHGRRRSSETPEGRGSPVRAQGSHHSGDGGAGPSAHAQAGGSPSATYPRPSEGPSLPPTSTFPGSLPGPSTTETGSASPVTSDPSTDPSRVWLPELIRRFASFLPANDVALRLRLASGSAASALPASSFGRVSMSLPVPPSEFAARWSDPAAMASLSFRRRHRLLCAVAAAGDVTNLRLAAAAAGVPLTPDVFAAAAAAGRTAVCRWLRAEARAPLGPLPLAAPLKAGRGRTVAWLLGSGVSMSGWAPAVAARYGHTRLLRHLLAAAAARPSGGGAVNIPSLLEGAAEGCDAATLAALHAIWIEGRDDVDLPGSPVLDSGSRTAPTGAGASDPDAVDSGSEASDGEPDLDLGFAGGRAPQAGGRGGQAPVRWLDERTQGRLVAAAAGSPTPDWAAKVDWLLASPRCYPRGLAAMEEVARRPDGAARLQWLLGRGFPQPDPEVILIAAAVGNADVVRLLLRGGGGGGGGGAGGGAGAVGAAAAAALGGGGGGGVGGAGGPGGALEPMGGGAAAAAAGAEVAALGGHTQVLEALEEAGVALDPGALLLAAAEGGQLRAARWLAERLPRGTAPRDGAPEGQGQGQQGAGGEAERGGGGGRRGFRATAAHAAAAAGSACLELLQLVVDELGAPLTGAAFARAAASASASTLPCLVWMLRQGCPPGCPSAVWQAAAEAGCPEVLEWLRTEAGVPLPDDGLPYAVAAGNGDLLSLAALLRMRCTAPPRAPRLTKAVAALARQERTMWDPLPVLTWLAAAGDELAAAVDWAAVAEAARGASDPAQRRAVAELAAKASGR